MEKSKCSSCNEAPPPGEEKVLEYLLHRPVNLDGDNASMSSEGKRSHITEWFEALKALFSIHGQKGERLSKNTIDADVFPKPQNTEIAILDWSEELQDLSVTYKNLKKDNKILPKEGNMEILNYLPIAEQIDVLEGIVNSEFIDDLQIRYDCCRRLLFLLTKDEIVEGLEPIEHKEKELNALGKMKQIIAEAIEFDNLLGFSSIEYLKAHHDYVLNHEKEAKESME